MSATIATDLTPRRIPVWKHPRVWRLLVIALLAEIGYAVLNISTMPVYLMAVPGANDGPIPNGRGMGASVVGIVLVAFLLSEAIFKSPMGSLADRYGHRTLMFLGPAVTTCTALLSVIVPHHEGPLEVVFFIFLRVLDGIGAAMLWPAAFALMGNTVEDNDRQQAMSLLNLCYMLGIALAMPIGGVVNDQTGYKWASLILAAVIFAGVAIAVWLLIPAHESRDVVNAKQQSEIGFADFIRSMKQIPGYLALAVVVFTGIGFPMAIIKPFAEAQLGMTETTFGGLVFPAAIAMAAFSLPLSKLGERMGRARAVHVGIGTSAAGLLFVSLGVVIPALQMPWALALAGIPLGVGFMMAIPAWMASVSDINPERRGANLGAVMTAQGIGAIIGAPIGSALYEKLQPYGMTLAHYSPFIGCSVFVTAGWLLSLRILRDPR